MRALWLENYKSCSPIVTNDVCVVTENPSKNEARIARQTVVPPNSESPVLVFWTMVRLQLIKSKFLARERKQVILTRRARKMSSFLPFFHLVTNVATKQLHLLKKMVITLFMESPTWQELPSRLSKPANDCCEVNVIYGPRKSGTSQNAKLQKRQEKRRGSIWI